MLRDAHGVELRIVKITDAGEIDFESLEAQFTDGKVKLLAVTHMSNVLGTYTPVERLAAFAHARGAKILIDGCQAIVHRRVDVRAIDADFYVFSGHKLYGPSGIGVLYAKRELLDAMPPFLGGGDMIASVSYERSSWAKPPHRFEAGTPAIIETIGMGAAIDYVEAIGFEAIAAHERALTDHALSVLAGIEGLRVLGSAQDRGGVISFTMKDAHAHDIATLLDRQGIAVRAGHHCAEPLMGRLGVTATARASFAVYTTREEIDALAAGLTRIKQIFN
jgi:cysteine desulfurase/selenocysteine lyase